VQKKWASDQLEMHCNCGRTETEKTQNFEKFRKIAGRRKTRRPGKRKILFWSGQDFAKKSMSCELRCEKFCDFRENFAKMYVM